jgi:hypothetical protein
VIKAVLLILAALPLCAQAEMYRWVDENGKVRYGDRPMGKEVKRVAGLYEPKATEAMPAPGMKADDLVKTYGEPERTQRISTKSGEVQIWTYGKSKQVKRDFVVKVEGGEVIEVLTDSALDKRPAAAAQPSAAEVQARAKAAEAAEYQREQESAERTAAAKKQRCNRLREDVQNIENRQRRGGSAATMDSLREQKRQAGNRLSAQDC